MSKSTESDLMTQILKDAADVYRGWLKAKHTTDAERELAALKLKEIERRLGE